MTCSWVELILSSEASARLEHKVRNWQPHDVADYRPHCILARLSLNMVALVSDVISFSSAPCTNAISRQRLKPSPAPPDFRSRESLARKKRSNIRVCISTGIISLELDIEKTALLPSRCILVRIQPPLMLWFTALSKRLRNNCRSKDLSPLTETSESIWFFKSTPLASARIEKSSAMS